VRRAPTRVVSLYGTAVALALASVLELQEDKCTVLFQGGGHRDVGGADGAWSADLIHPKGYAACQQRVTAQTRKVPKVTPCTEKCPPQITYCKGAVRGVLQVSTHAEMRASHFKLRSAMNE